MKNFVEWKQPIIPRSKVGDTFSERATCPECWTRFTIQRELTTMGWASKGKHKCKK